MEKSTTLKEIAYELDLSINTVSRALRDCDNVNKETKKKVIDMAIKLGYMPMTQTQFVKRENKRNITFIIGDIKNIFYLINCKYLAKIVSSHGDDYTLMFFDGDCVGANDIKQIIAQRGDGIISLLPFDEESLSICKLQKIPLVFLSVAKMIGIGDVIHYDVQNATDLVVNYLLNYHKNKTLIYIGYLENYESINRLRCLKNSLNKMNETYNLICLDALKQCSDIYELIKKKNGYLSLICFSDSVCYEVLEYLNQVLPNIRLIYPQLHIVSFDAFAKHVSGFIDITTIDYDYEEACKKSCEILYKKFQLLNDEVQTIILPVDLHIRRIK